MSQTTDFMKENKFAWNLIQMIDSEFFPSFMR